jgi:N-acetylneuraminate synthase/sialic acid synthase
MQNKNDIYIIAEIGNNHQGNVKIAMELMKAAKKSGADAVKTQKRDNKSLYTKSFFNQKYDNPNSFGLTYGLHREKLELSKDDYKVLIDYAKEINIDFFITPFDLKSLEFLEKFKFKSYKLASADITNTILQTEVAKTNKNIFMSTGGATLEDVKRAKDNIFKYNKKLTILQCTASYPVKIEDMNLNVISTFKKQFPNIRIGLSDHENGIDAGPIAYMLGARVFEKHFTLNRANKGTDNAFSLEPTGLEKFIRNIKRVEILLGSHEKKQLPEEEKPLIKMRKSPVLNCIKKKGDVLKISDFDLKSPGLGIQPYQLEKIIGKKTNKNLCEEHYISMDDILNE